MGFGVLSVLQAVFLPGFVILCLSGTRPESKLQTFLLSLGLSHLANYILVAALGVLGLFSPRAIRLVLAIECLAIGWIVFSCWRRPPGVSRPSIGDTPKPLFAELQFLAVASVSVPLFFLWEGIGSGFYLGDAFGSWHRWALDWFEGRLPVETWRYPQLMPTNWAAMYAVQGTPDVHFFAKSYMAIFPIAIQLVFIATARATQKSRYFLGAILYAVVLVVFTNRYLINDGYADIAMSFLCFLSFMCLANWREGQKAPGCISGSYSHALRR